MSREHEIDLPWFAEQIRKKLELPKNVEKESYITHATTRTLMSGLIAEVAELDDALLFETDEAAILECCDVAAYAMMIAANIHRKPMRFKGGSDALPEGR